MVWFVFFLILISSCSFTVTFCFMDSSGEFHGTWCLSSYWPLLWGLLLVADARVLSAFLTSSGLQWHLRGSSGEHLSHQLLVYFESSLVMVFLLEALEDSDLYRLAWVVGAGFWSSFFLKHFLWLQKQCMIKKNVDTTERNKENCSPPHGDNDIGVLVPVCRC